MRVLSCTTDTKWPLPRWSAERLEQMKSELSNAANDPFAGFIAQVKLLATDGQISEAQSLLEQSQSWLKPATLDHGLFRNLLSAAFLAHASELAVAWLVRRFDASYGVSIDVSRSDGARDVVVLQVHGNDARFLFDRGLFDPPGHLVLIQRWADTYPLLDAFMASSHRVDGSVAINLGDGGHHPGLCFCDNRPSYFLIPDSLYMDSGRYNSIRAKFREQNVPWHNRVPVAFWRGATTGRPSRPGIGWRGLPRIQLSLFTHDHPDLIDARITNVVQIADPAAREWLQSSDLLRSHVPFHAFQKFRYQIDIDGNTNSWPGLFMKLLSGSPVVKIASSTGHQQWYYDRLRPWINFVPAAADMTDLIEKVTWLRANDEVARKIGDAGRELAEAMTEPQEIVRAAPVIAAAIRTAAGHAMTDLTFGTGMAGNDVLRTGWLPPVADGVSAAGFEGHLELPKPLGLDDYILSVDVSLAASPSQRLTIMANGEILVQRTLNERTTIHCALRRSVATADEKLSVSLHFPDARINASPANPLDTRRLSVTLHGIRVTAARCCSEGEHPDITVAREELLSGGSESVVHDLWATCPTPLSAEKPRALRTIHGTVMYADLASGRVRHGKLGAAPANLFLDQGNGRANLVRVGAGGREFGVRLRPEGGHAASAQRQHETADRFVRTFEIVDVGDPERRTFGLRGAGLFVCAEIDGSVTLSRDTPGAWERFAVEPNET